ncbi:MAG: hypothetical protein E7544_01265 [Ruminococcaceae bacterium]|nr:hypothetical protein [Oscillospiraceae bacterium]
MTEKNENLLNEEITQAYAIEAESVDTEEATAEDLSTAEEATEEAKETTEEEKTEAPVVDTNEKKKSKAPLIISLVALIAVVVGALIFTFSANSDKTFDPIFYFEEDALYMKNLGEKRKNPVKVCDASYEGSYLSTVMFNSTVTEAVFGLEEETGTSVYSYNLTDPSASPVKIAEGVCSFVKNETTGIITCIIGEESKLVQFDAELNEIPVAENVDYFEISADGLTILYISKDGPTFLKQKDKEAVELTKDGTIEYSDDNLSLFYILENESLFKVQATGEKTLIDKGISATSFSSTDGYYYKTVRTILIKDLFEDDMAAADNEIKIPENNDSEAYTLYTERLERDEIRSVIIDPETTYTIQDVYYYNGTEGKLIAKNVFGDEFSFFDQFSSDSEVPNLFCSIIDTDKIKKVRMSDLWKAINSEDDTFFGGLDAVTELITEPLIECCTDYFIYRGDFAAPIDIKGIVYDSMFDATNNLLYISISNDAFSDTALYKIPLTENGLGKSELVCENVNSFETTISEDGKLYYIEQTYLDDASIYSVSNVYYDSELIAENVISVLEYDLEKGIFFMEKQTDSEEGSPDFEGYASDSVLYNMSTDEEIVLDNLSDGYYELFETPAGKILIHETNYDLENAPSKLYSIENGKMKLLATIGSPEYFNFMSDCRDGSGYIDWEDDENWDEDWLDGSFPLDF